MLIMKFAEIWVKHIIVFSVTSWNFAGIKTVIPTQQSSKEQTSIIPSDA